jgi:excisionase family DNA binding protein
MPRIKYPQGSDLAVTVKEAARLLGVSEYLAWEMVKTSQLRSVKFGNRLRRVPRSAIMELLEGGKPNS